MARMMKIYRHVGIAFFSIVMTLLPFAVQAGATIRWERASCLGTWQTHMVYYKYTDADRRNYYWIYIKTSPLSFPDEFAGPFGSDEHCEHIGISNNYYWFAKGCLNNDPPFCDESKLTNQIRVPRQSCRGGSGGTP